jgi:hypothetical protein
MKDFDIGIVGLAGAGKDTAGTAVCELGWARGGFANALKLLCERGGWDGNKDVFGRALLQKVGMAFRNYDQDTWVKLARKTAEARHWPICWTDVRFVNEADFVRNERNGIIIRIIRPGMALEKAHQHESELNQYMVSAEHTVQNEGSVADLHAKIREIIKFEKQKRNEN